MFGWQRRGDTIYIVGTVSVAHFMSHVYLLAFPPLFPLLATEFDVTVAQLGLLVTAIYFPTLLFQLPLGEIVDRIGAKRILVAGLVVTSMGIVFSGLATAYWMLLAGALISGLGQTAFHPADYALLETVTETHNEGKAFSVHTFAGFAGFAAAPILIGSIGISYNWQVALITAGIVGFIYATFLWLTTDSVHVQRINEMETDHSNSPSDTIREMASFVRQTDILLVFTFYLFHQVALVGLQSFTTVFGVNAYGFDEAAANTLLTVFLITAAGGVLIGGPLADRTSHRDIIIITCFVAAIGVWAMVVTNWGFVSVLLLLAAVGVLFGIALPSRDKFANTMVDAGAAGKSFGFFFTGLSLGAVISPTVLGLIIDLWSVVIAFLIIGGIFVLSAAVIIVARILDYG